MADRRSWHQRAHTSSCFPLARFGTDAQRARWLPDMLGGALLGAYCLSEPDSGSDAGALRTRATRVADRYQLDGTKAWITHAGQADFYTVMARTSDERSRGISCFLVAGDTPGLRAGPPEHKMGLQGSPTGQLHLYRCRRRRRPADRRRGPGLHDRARRPRHRPPRHRCLRRGVGSGSARRRARLRRPAPSVRALDRRLRGRGVPARRHGDRVSRPAARCISPPPAAPMRAIRFTRRSRDGEALLHRYGDAGDHGCRAGARRIRLRRGLSRSSATCAKPRRCRSWKARIRCNDSLSVGSCGRNDLIELFQLVELPRGADHSDGFAGVHGQFPAGWLGLPHVSHVTSSRAPSSVCPCLGGHWLVLLTAPATTGRPGLCVVALRRAVASRTGPSPRSEP